MSSACGISDSAELPNSDGMRGVSEGNSPHPPPTQLSHTTDLSQPHPAFRRRNLITPTGSPMSISTRVVGSGTASR